MHVAPETSVDPLNHIDASSNVFVVNAKSTEFEELSKREAANVAWAVTCDATPLSCSLPKMRSEFKRPADTQPVGARTIRPGALADKTTGAGDAKANLDATVCI